MINKRGAALILVFLIMVGLSGIAFVFLTMVGDEIGSAGTGLWNMQAFYIAEAGLAKARWALTVDGKDETWSETDEPFGEGTYTVNITYNDDDETYTITSEGYIPNDTNPIAKRMVIESNIPVTVGTNLSLDATISTSSEKLPQNPATNANDGDSGTKWEAGSKGDAWLKLDFGSATTFDKAVINGQKNINSVTIEYSSNDSDYNSVTNMVESPTWTFTFDSVSARYLRLNMDVNRKKKAKVKEFETYDTAMGGLGRGTFSTSW